jgi:pyridoxal phosphate enzyme (YggS family)
MMVTQQEPESLRARLEEVRRRIERSARLSGRAPEDVTLIAVSKTHSSTVVREAIDAGASEFGENRVQEADAKIEDLGRLEGMRWHLIGHLQANKARRAVRLFDVIHTVDSASLVERLERLCADEARARLDVLLQVDLAGEASKSGAGEGELAALHDAFGACERLRCVGLMTLPPFFEEAELVRPYFRRLRALRDDWRGRGLFGEGEGELSMGMSHDFEAAIEEGATMVRVGTAIFGVRGVAV